MTTTIMCNVAKININEILNKVTVLGHKYSCSDVIDSGDYLTVVLNKLKRNQVISTGETAVTWDDISNKYDLVKKCIW